MQSDSEESDLDLVGEDLTSAFGPQVIAAPPAALPEGFDEVKYLRANPDVAAAIEAGEYGSGLEHYQRYGQQERRLTRLDYQHGWPLHTTSGFPAHGIDAVFWTASGDAMAIGWIDDAAAPFTSLSLLLHETTLGVTDAIARCRRLDAERAVGAAEGRLLGFWSVFRARIDPRSEALQLVLMTAAGPRVAPVVPQMVSDERLREIALEYLAGASYWGNPTVEAFGFLDRGIGQTLIAANRAISARLAAGAFCRRFGPQQRRFTGSIVVCLYGRMEFMFLQAALFTTGAGWQDYEFIYVTNSPELTERMFKEAALVTRIYGINVSLVILPGNAGFGVANNVAAGFAQSDRILIVNPDVFPRRDDWACVHSRLLATLAEAQSRLFGVPMFYDDGSLMHGGMYFELDEGFSVAPGGVKQRELARVEHYGKGAPPDTAQFLRARMVPAVSGAFMSIARSWFETLGGFSSDYVFGHYEDADLCLRSLAAGSPVWLHHLPLWHMEGKGSSRRPMHEGGSLVNRWHFTREWGATLHDGLLGPAPARLAGLAEAGIA